MNITYTGTPLPQVVQILSGYDVRVQGYIERIAMVSRSTIMERLKVHLQTGAEHFDVTIRPNATNGYTITVGSIDEVGVFLFHGVEKHEITGVSMPIGNDRFAQVVQHPGFDSKSESIYRAVVEGIAIAREAVEFV
jgi:hypothetical protein